MVPVLSPFLNIKIVVLFYMFCMKSVSTCVSFSPPYFSNSFWSPSCPGDFPFFNDFKAVSTSFTVKLLCLHLVRQITLSDILFIPPPIFCLFPLFLLFLFFVVLLLAIFVFVCYRNLLSISLKLFSNVNFGANKLVSSRTCLYCWYVSGVF